MALSCSSDPPSDARPMEQPPMKSEHSNPDPTPKRLKIPVIKSRDLGLKTLFENKDAAEVEVDIVAVHGIGAHPVTAWVYEEQDRKVDWLADATMLPAVCPKARVLAFGYDSIWVGENPVHQSIDSVATSLLRGLVGKRNECPHRPIIFVGHCLGGIIMQQAYILAQLHEVDYPDIYKHVTGLLSLGTPYDDASVEKSLHQMFEEIVIMRLRTDRNLVNYLGRDNNLKKDIVHNFTRQVNIRTSPPRLFCFFEQRTTNFGAIAGFQTEREFVVNESSGTLNGHPKEGLALDHFAINKFEDNEDHHFICVSNQIKKMVDEARSILDGRGLNEATAASVSKHHVPSATLPFRDEPNFVHREKILDSIEEKFGNSERVALYGGAGIGKTHVAVEYAYKFDRDFPKSKIHWVNAGSAEQFELSFALIADTLHLRDPGKSALESVHHRLKQDSSGYWLMVLDGLDETVNLRATNPSHKGRPLLDFVPMSLYGKVLITTRSKSLANRLVKQKDEYVIEVSALTDDGASQLLLGKPLKDSATHTSAVRVAKALGYSPVALTLAYAYLHTVEKGKSLGEYLKMLESIPKAQNETNNDEAGVQLAWQSLYDILNRKHPETARLMLLLGSIDLQSVEIFFLTGAAGRNVEKHIRILVRYGLVEPRTNRPAVSVTAMIRRCVRKWLEQKNEKYDYEEKALSMMSTIYPAPEEKEYDKCEALHPCALAILKYREPVEMEVKREKASLLSKMANYLLYLGQNQNAARYFTECLSLREQDPDASRDLVNETKTAIAHATKSRDCPENLSRPDVMVLRSDSHEPDCNWQEIFNLALQDQKLGFHQRAETRYLKAYQSTKRLFGEHSPESLRILASLAITEHSLGRTEQAWTLIQNVLVQQRDVLGHDHPETLVTHYNIALILQENGQLEAAGENLRLVLDLCADLLGPEDPRTLLTLSQLVENYKIRGLLKDAEELDKMLVSHNASSEKIKQSK